MQEELEGELVRSERRQAAKRIVESSPDPHPLADSIAREEHFLALPRELEYEQRRELGEPQPDFTAA
jgi:hypothetical protein